MKGGTREVTKGEGDTGGENMFVILTVTFLQQGRELGGPLVEKS